MLDRSLSAVPCSIGSETWSEKCSRQRKMNPIAGQMPSCLKTVEEWTGHLIRRPLKNTPPVYTTLEGTQKES